jgi:hypothetical protein
MPIKSFLMYSVVCDLPGCINGLEIHPVDLDEDNEWHAQAFATVYKGWIFLASGSISLCPKHKRKKHINKVVADAQANLNEVSPNKDLLEEYQKSKKQR